MFESIYLMDKITSTPLLLLLIAVFALASVVILMVAVWLVDCILEKIFMLFPPSREKALKGRITETHDLFTTQRLDSGHRYRERYRGI